jgi:hypothetical protein
MCLMIVVKTRAERSLRRLHRRCLTAHCRLLFGLRGLKALNSPGFIGRFIHRSLRIFFPSSSGQRTGTLRISDNVGSLARSRLCTDLCLFDYLLLFLLVFSEYRNEILRNRCEQLEILRKLHQIIELYCLVLRRPASLLVLKLYLFASSKLTEVGQDFAFSFPAYFCWFGIVASSIELDACSGTRRQRSSSFSSRLLCSLCTRCRPITRVYDSRINGRIWSHLRRRSWCCSSSSLR